MLNDTFAKILPALEGLLIRTGVGVKDIGTAKVWTKKLRHFRPSHEFLNGEEFEKLGFLRNLCVAGIFVYAVKEIVLFVIVGGEDDIVDNSL